MGRVKLFLRADCPKCGGSKGVGSFLKKEGFKVIFYDLDTADGLAEAAFYGIKAVPTLVLEDEEENPIATFLGEVPTPAEVKKNWNLSRNQL